MMTTARPVGHCAVSSAVASEPLTRSCGGHAKDTGTGVLGEQPISGGGNVRTPGVALVTRRWVNTSQAGVSEPMPPKRLGPGSRALVCIVISATILGESTSASGDTDRAERPTQIPPGSVARWGSYFGGPNAVRKTPTAVSGLTDVVAIDAGNSSNYALECAGGRSKCATDGARHGLGRWRRRATGDGLKANSQNQVHQVRFPADVHIVSIGEARNEGFAIDSTGQGWGWGNNGHGIHLIGNSLPQPVPIKIPTLKSEVMVQGGQDHVLWLQTNGTVLTCGAGGSDS